MSRLTSTAPLVLGALALTTLAHAEPAAPALPSDPVLAGLIADALAARPELAQARAEVTAARERIPQVRALPDPMLQVGVQNDSFTSWEIGEMETSYYTIMASQTVPWPRKRRLRGELAALDVDQAAQGITRLRLSTEAEVRRAYLALVLTRDRLALLDELRALWERSASIARQRYETGQGAQSDVLRAPLELSRLAQRRLALEAEQGAQVQALNRLRGRPLGEPITPAVHLADLPLPALAPEAALAEDALARSPELAAARVGARQADRAVALARTGTLPDPTFNVGLMPKGVDMQPMWAASVSIPLPIWRGQKQRRAVAETRALTTARQQELEALAQVLRLRAAQRRTALAAALGTIALYRDGLLVQSQLTADSTLAQYQVGKVTLASVLEVNAGLLADRDGYLQALAQAHQLEIERAEVSLDVAGLGATGGMARAAMPGAGAVASGAPAAAAPSTSSSAAAPAGGAAPMSSM